MSAGRTHSLRALPAGVWALGFGSLFMDMSSELIHALLPLYLVTVLHTPMATVGLLEGIAEATAAITKVFSGALSDYIGRRKPLVILGYGLATLTKPVFPLATGLSWIFGARFLDRVGKGIRGAPRDALVADITPEGQRGAAYGLRQALDSVGALAGPALAIALTAGLGFGLRAAMWVAVVPAAITVLLLITYVREPAGTDTQTRRWRSPLARAALRELPARYWAIVALSAVFTMARFSEAFLVLRAQDAGLPMGYVPLVMVVMNLIYATLSYPAGAWADRRGTRMPLLLGLAVLVIADILLALVATPAGVLAGAALWGLHLALTQGLLSTLVADRAPAQLRATAFGIFNLVSGLALLLASTLAGQLWGTVGPAATFLAGGAFAALAALSVALMRPARPQPGA